MNIEITHVTKRYGSITALDDCSCTIPSGSTCAILGTNGAGKTTLFHLLVGLASPDEGTIEIGDRPIGVNERRVRKQVGYLPERVGFPDELTAREVLQTHAAIRGLRDEGLIDRTLETVELDYAADRRVGGFSNGMRGRLGLATAILSRPSVLILDEPTAGLDPTGVTRFYRIVERLVETTDATVLLATHDLANVERLCDHVVVIDDGRVILEGSVERLRGEAPRRTTVRAIDPAMWEGATEVADRIPSARVEHTTEETVVIRVDPSDLVDCINLIESKLQPDGIDVSQGDLRDAFVGLVDTRRKAQP